MPKILLLPQGRILETSEVESIFQILRRHDIPIGSSCGGEGVCDKCRVTVVEGVEHLSGISDVEALLTREHGFSPGERVACQTLVRGDVSITTGYW